MTPTCIYMSATTLGAFIAIASGSSPWLLAAVPALGLLYHCLEPRDLLERR